MLININLPIYFVLLFWAVLFFFHYGLYFWVNLFICSSNIQIALYSYLDSPSTFPPADKLISKQILGMLRGKYNSMSYSQLLDCVQHKTTLPGHMEKKCWKKLLFSQVGLKIWTCSSMWIPLQWCNNNFHRNTPLGFFFSFFSLSGSTPAPSAPLYMSLSVIKFVNLNWLINVRVCFPHVICVNMCKNHMKLSPLSNAAPDTQLHRALQHTHSHRVIQHSSFPSPAWSLGYWI